MNRRSALWLTMLLGGFAPRWLWAQTPGAPARTRRSSANSRATRAEDEDRLPAAEADDDNSPPADFPNEPGRRWLKIDISKYTDLPHSSENPQAALIEWIFRRTESGTWHGDKVAVLCANRSILRAYHTPNVLKQVAEMVDRFIDAEADLLSVRVRFVAADDPRWRHFVFDNLTPLASGPQGQQVWTLKLEDTASILAQMQVTQSSKLIADRKFELVNGQTVTMHSSLPRNYVAGLQRESAVGLGFQPAVKQLEEGVVLRFSPLLVFEGDGLDAAIDLRSNTIRYLHKTPVLAPREIGPREMTIDVPEVSETRLNQTISGWPLGRSLLISAGIQPGILQSKTGFLNLRIPGTYPTSTELLVFIDVEPMAPPARAARDRRRS
jgi:hypothetical protein